MALAAFRKSPSTDLKKLAEKHIEHDLTPEDRDALKSAAYKISIHANIGSLLGLGLGLALAYRIRTNRIRLFEAFKAAQKPTHVKFADGREEAIPDITPLLQPTKLGDFATYTFFGIAGLFLGGETGVVTGAASARRIITGDPERKKRIERAFRAFRADVLRAQIERLEKQGMTSADPEDSWLLV